MTATSVSRLCRRAAVLAALIVSLGASPARAALIFTLTPTGNANADAGFQRAANYWSSIYSDSITVNITSGFAALGPGILGQAGSTYFGTTFSVMKAALTADATSADDATMVAGLPGGTTYSRYINGTSTSGGAAHVQTNISSMRMTNANAKAIGLLAANNAAQDAAITFSSNFNFDFDPSDGITAGFYDFVGIAIHELGHAMGFTSGVDVLDGNSPPVNGPFTDTQFSPFTTLLDFTRCSQTSEAAGADIDWRIGTAAKDFAIDGNCGGSALVTNAWSTGVFFGDGRQASHWKDGLGLGIMDPTAVPPGSANVVTALDIQALDVIGWTRTPASPSVPEPVSMLLLGIGVLGFGTLRRRRQND